MTTKTFLEHMPASSARIFHSSQCDFKAIRMHFEWTWRCKAHCVNAFRLCRDFKKCLLRQRQNVLPQGIACTMHLDSDGATCNVYFTDHIGGFQNLRHAPDDLLHSRFVMRLARPVCFR